MSLIEQKLLELENRAMDYIGSAPEGTAAYLETAASSIGGHAFIPARGNIEAGHRFPLPHGAGKPRYAAVHRDSGDTPISSPQLFPKINAFILAQLLRLPPAP